MNERDLGLNNTERLGPNDTAWLGGFFETAGSVGFYSSKDPNRSSYPYLQVTDKNGHLLTQMSEKFGGNVKPRGRSSRLMITGHRAVNLIKCAFDHAPSRQEMIEKFGDWENANGIYEKHVAAEGTSPRDRLEVPIETYISLLRNPAFLAGVIDARGVFSTYRRKRKNGALHEEPRLELPSTNIHLLEALTESFGGTVVTHASKGAYGVSKVYLLERAASLDEVSEAISGFSINASNGISYPES